MEKYSTKFLDDKNFLRELDNQQLRETTAKIIVLNWNEVPIQEIQGKILTGSTISIDGNSSMRRTCTLSVLVDDETYDVMDIKNILSLNKKIQIYTGVLNEIDDKYENIVWFPMGMFVINQCSFSHDTSGLKLSISCKDKMCLLNGDIAGQIPAQVAFDSYKQRELNGDITERKNLIYDIIYTSVINYGGEDPSRVFINDVPLQIKQLTRFVGTSGLYFNHRTGLYTLDETKVDENGEWESFGYNENVGYCFTSRTPQKQLVSGIGSTVTSMLDECVSMLGNYEYYYDINGNFIFQEKKNYLNTSYDPLDIAVTKYHLDNATKEKNNLDIIALDNYYVDYNHNAKQVYTFNEGSKLVSSYSNNIPYTQIKNDFHIWGKNSDSQMIHYHLVIKKKPKISKARQVVFLRDEKGEYNGRLRLAYGTEVAPIAARQDDVLVIKSEDDAGKVTDDETQISTLVIYDENDVQTDKDTLIFLGGEIEEYIPDDWRAELYLQGLEVIAAGGRPDIYQQELLDFFDMIYDFRKKAFKSEKVKTPNNLKYWLDYLEPDENLGAYSVDSIQPRIYSKQEESVVKLFNNDVPDYIIIDKDNTLATVIMELKNKCDLSGQKYTQVSGAIGNYLEPVSAGYAASDAMRELLYQYTTFTNSITITSLPILYLEPNTRITVEDKYSNIHGDYIISSLTLPLDGSGTMNIQASKALERI